MLIEKMTDCQTVVLRRLAHNFAEETAFGRFIQNEKVICTQILTPLYHRVAQNAEGKSILLIQDTTDMNFESHLLRIQPDTGLGDITDKGYGFFLHPNVAVDAETGNCLGIADVHIFTRPIDRKRKKDRAYQHQPIEEKESFRWIESVQRSEKILEKAQSITSISDRESDIYEEFDRIPNAKTHVLIRSREDRRLADSDILLYETLANQPVAGTYEIEIRKDGRHGLQKRTACIEVRYAPVKLKKSSRCNDPNAKKWVEVYGVEAHEVGINMPEKQEDRILWRLLTTHTVESPSDAVQIIQWYKQRWLIEQFFRLLKSKGLNFTESQLESGENLKKLCCLALWAAIPIFQMTYARQTDCPQPIHEVFSSQEQQCLFALNQQYEGKTDKQKNPNPPKTMAWAAWIIARIGGWKTHETGKPGVITMTNGMKRFNDLFYGWKLAQKDVLID